MGKFTKGNATLATRRKMMWSWVGFILMTQGYKEYKKFLFIAHVILVSCVHGFGDQAAMQFLLFFFGELELGRSKCLSFFGHEWVCRGVYFDGVAFKNAHTIVGKLIKHALDNSVEIKSMTESELHKFSDKLVGKDIIKLLNPKVSVESKKSIKRG